jgi:hypothetical protein
MNAAPGAAPASPPPGAPRPWARASIGVAVRVLPAGTVRERYRQELTVELYDLNGAAQLRHAYGVLTHIWALRPATARTTRFTPEGTMKRPPLLCRLNLRHHWVFARTEDNQRYRRCSRCGKDDPRLGTGPIHAPGL